MVKGLSRCLFPPLFVKNTLSGNYSSKQHLINRIRRQSASPRPFKLQVRFEGTGRTGPISVRCTKRQI
ncbi:hypothetical protein ACRE_080820 [Hapsidospora chrysogenum ATCC 11550]|uniref:Uncharacterized protein n=1 Tax=Hapsidospora chrysogenum (strain ATCC 11550 / CBS 779.69 / DSM 880 / IAM 14645 / JCM 23072 / IMI 49137) TaxID=857340 RepID=A0A086SVU4_HAPC1|nr:hypothetical protein ACRE_080820 [Hapsidospora chrysogenum ATCC 11550]